MQKKWKDDYEMTKSRIVLTNPQVQVPGVRVLAWHQMNNAISPLVPHYHENAFEFTIICDGSFTFQTSEKSFRVNGGDIFVAYPNEVHSTSQMPLSHGEIYWLQVEVHDTCHFLDLDPLAAHDLINRLYHIRKHVLTCKNNISAHLIKQAFQLSKACKNPHLAASYLSLFLNLLAETSTEQQSISTEIYHALTYIYNNIEADISLEDLASCANLSIPQFKVRFKQEIGTSPRSFVNMQKIETAKQLLLLGKNKTEIAIELGFNTSSYFSAVFKKYTLSTPSEYLKKYAATKSSREDFLPARSAGRVPSLR